MDCVFCYLGEQRKNSTLLPISKLHDTLSILSNIEVADLYGGELNHLRSEYVLDLYDCIKGFNPSSINVTTNLSRINPAFLESDIDLYVSWDHIVRPNSSKVLENLKKIDRSFSIITLGTKQLNNPKLLIEYVELLNTLENLISVEIKPYSSNQFNSNLGSAKDFEEIVKFLMLYPERKFGLENETLLQTALDKNHPLLNRHLFINPYGEICVIDFDEDGKEYFRKVEDTKQLQAIAIEDVIRMWQNPDCLSCKYMESCLAEHIAYSGCTGHKGLLEWYERVEI